jgi:zinc knuckle protein
LKESMNCYRCSQRGHFAADCPEQYRASSRAEHEARIAVYVRRFIDGDITAIEKQHMIREENRLWYGDDMPAALRR